VNTARKPVALQNRCPKEKKAWGEKKECKTVFLWWKGKKNSGGTTGGGGRNGCQKKRTAYLVETTTPWGDGWKTKFTGKQ